MRHIYPLADSSLSSDKDQFVMVFDTGKGGWEKNQPVMILKKRGKKRKKNLSGKYNNLKFNLKRKLLVF